MANEAFRMCGIGRLENMSPLELDKRCATEVDVGWRVKAQARVMVRIVVPAEEPLAERSPVFDRTEALRELRSILERLELALLNTGCRSSSADGSGSW